jgi:4-hydroxy-tetrahydrodipicolinate reductase
MNKKVRIAVAGCCGRMGRSILKIGFDDPKVEVVAVFEREGHQDINKDIGIVLGIGEKKIIIADSFLSSVQSGKAEPDCLIDFTTASSTVQNIKQTIDSRIAMVIGTTGLQEQDIQTIISASLKVPIVFSPNMSIGVNILFKIVSEIAGKMQDYNVEIVEVHHNMKKDAPSGTALRIAENIARARKQRLDKDAVYGRKGMTGPRSSQEIGIHSVRAGDVIGEHTVIFAGPGERLELIHKAHSRDTFAAGAILAAKFVVTQKPGIYEMSNVLGI